MKHDSVCILNLNIRGLLNNIDELKYVIRKTKPEICVVTETHVTSNILDHEIEIPGFKYIRSDSHSTHTGGVVVYITKKLKYENIKIIATTYLWMVSVDIKTAKHDKNKIVAVYMSANESKAEILNYFEQWLDENCLDCNLIICGDFNINVSEKTTYSQRLLRICSDFGLKQFVNSVTRRTNVSATTIDLCFSNQRVDVIITDDEQISDHHNMFIYIKCPISNSKAKNRTIKVWKGYNDLSLSANISAWIDEWEEMSRKNCNVKTEWLLNNLNETADKFINLRTVRSIDEFFEYELEQMRKQKNLLYKTAQYSSDNNQNNWDEYRRYRNVYKQTIDRKKYECMQRRLDAVSGDVKGTWKLLKTILNGNVNDIDFITTNGVDITDHKLIADAFNEYFVTAVEQISANIPHVEYNNDDITFEVDNIFEFKKVSISDVKKHLREFNKKTSYDNHNISFNYILDCIHHIAIILTDIINSSFDEAVFPTSLRESIIVPIQKVNGTAIIEQYRPINTLPCMEKLIEKAACVQLNKFIDENRILGTEQSGFRNNHSCESALNHIIDEWKTN